MKFNSIHCSDKSTNNFIFIVENLRLNNNDKGQNENGTLGPSKVVYKTYAKNLEVKEINPSWIQSLVSHELYKHGWGTKMYGAFKNGRIEEFVNCHSLSHEEVLTPEISKDVAKIFARFHSLKSPITKGNDFSLKDLISALDLFQEDMKKLKKIVESSTIKQIDDLKNAEKLIPNRRGKTVAIFYDC